MLVVFLLACNTAPSEGVDSVGDPADTAACPPGGTTLTWGNFGEQFFVDWCQECHNYTTPAANVPEGMVFYDESFVWSVAPLILDRVVNAASATAPPMPPPPDARSSEIESRENAIRKILAIEDVQEWLTCGEPTGG